jgi:class 3 adenylate cyclase
VKLMGDGVMVAFGVPNVREDDARPTARATTFVGRDEELERLLAQYHAAVTGSRAQLAVVLGARPRAIRRPATWGVVLLRPSVLNNGANGHSHRGLH